MTSQQPPQPPPSQPPTPPPVQPPMPPTTPPPVQPPQAPYQPGGYGPPPGPGSWVKDAWKLVVENIGTSILMMLLPAVPMLAVFAIMGLSAVPALTSRSDAAQMLSAGGMMMSIVISALILVVVMPALQVGVLSCFWEMIRTRKLTFDRIMDGIPLFLSALGLGLIFGVIGFAIGAVANLIPVLGQLVSFAVTFPLMAWSSIALYHMAVQKAGAIDAVSYGWQILSSDFLNMSLAGVVAWLIMLAGVLACGLGTLVAAPVVNTMWGLAYRDMGKN